MEQLALLWFAFWERESFHQDSAKTVRSKLANKAKEKKWLTISFAKQ